MAKTNYESVDQYIAAHPEPVQAILQVVRTVIRKAVPKAEEGISYQIPTYKLQGRAVLHFAGWKQHYSLYPAGEQLVLAFQQELAPYEVNDKGTIRLPLSEPVPVKLIERIAKFRVKEIAGRAAPKPTASKKATSKKSTSKKR